MKHIKQFESKKFKKEEYSDYLTKSFETSTKVKVEFFGNLLDIKFTRYTIDEIFMKKIFDTFGTDIKFSISQKPYSNSVTIKVYSIPISILDMMLDVKKYNL